MMEKRTDVFLFYSSYIESVLELPKELKHEIVYCIGYYGIFGIMPNDMTPMAKAMLYQVKNLIDKSILRRKQASEAGKASKPNNGRKKEFIHPSYEHVKNYVLDVCKYDEDTAKLFYAYLESIGFQGNGYKTTFDNWIKKCK